jgi:prepilin-type processing-associated H-X9-DG protein
MLAREVTVLKVSRRYNAAVGFSLIELLVVIGIVALLIGILLPVLAGARQSAQRVTCSSNLRQLGLIVTTYTNDSDDQFPPARPIPLPFAAFNDADPPLYVPLTPYLPVGTAPETNRVYACPDDDTVYPLAGMSYAYSASVSGRSLADILDSRFLRRLNWNESQVEVLSDFDGEEGGTDFALEAGGDVRVPKRHFKRNILFADGRVDITVR